MAVECYEIMRFPCLMAMLNQNNVWYILTILISVNYVCRSKNWLTCLDYIVSVSMSYRSIVQVLKITRYQTILSFYDAAKLCFHSSLWSTSLYGYIAIFAYFQIHISLCFTLELKVLKVGRLIASSIVHMNTCQNKFGILQAYIMFKIVGEICVSWSWNKLYKNREYILKGYNANSQYNTSYSDTFLIWEYRASSDYRVKLYMNEFQMSSINIHLPQSIKRKR